MKTPRGRKSGSGVAVQPRVAPRLGLLPGMHTSTSLNHATRHRPRAAGRARAAGAPAARPRQQPGAPQRPPGARRPASRPFPGPADERSGGDERAWGGSEGAPPAATADPSLLLPRTSSSARFRAAATASRTRDSPAGPARAASTPARTAASTRAAAAATSPASAIVSTAAIARSRKAGRRRAGRPMCVPRPPPSLSPHSPSHPRQPAGAPAPTSPPPLPVMGTGRAAPRGGVRSAFLTLLSLLAALFVAGRLYSTTTQLAEVVGSGGGRGLGVARHPRARGLARRGGPPRAPTPSRLPFSAGSSPASRPTAGRPRAARPPPAAPRPRRAPPLPPPRPTRTSCFTTCAPRRPLRSRRWPARGLAASARRLSRASGRNLSSAKSTPWRTGLLRGGRACGASGTRRCR